MNPSFLQRGGLWVIAQSILMLSVIGLAGAFPGDWTQAPMIVAGVLIFVLGGFIGISGIFVLGGNRTPFPDPRPGSQLIQRGIYARMRHPLYTSVMLASLGWALIWQSGPALMAALVLIPFFDAKARAEERRLRKRFPEYRHYESQVKRFIPGIY